MKRGYTLTELLVVIAIVAVMAAVLIPVFASAKKETTKAVCASNMHQIYLAVKLYDGDFGEHPPSLDFKSFQSYYPTVLTCPSSKNIDQPNLRKVDYTYVGQPPADRVGEAMNACREARGSKLPLVFDDNHIDSFIDKSDLKSKILVVREDGSCTPIPAKDAYLIKTPCDPVQVPQWYNF